MTDKKLLDELARATSLLKQTQEKLLDFEKRLVWAEDRVQGLVAAYDDVKRRLKKQGL